MSTKRAVVVVVLSAAFFTLIVAGVFFGLRQFRQPQTSQIPGIAESTVTSNHFTITFVSNIPEKTLRYVSSQAFEQALRGVAVPTLRTITITIAEYPATGLPSIMYYFTTNTAGGTFNYGFDTTKDTIHLYLNLQGFTPTSAFTNQLVQTLVLSIAAQQNDSGQDKLILGPKTLQDHLQHLATVTNKYQNLLKETIIQETP